MIRIRKLFISLQWHHNGRYSVSNHQPHYCLLNRLFRRRSKNISKLRVTGLCAGNSPGTGEIPAQMASNAENVSIWWRHHVELQPHTSRGLWVHADQSSRTCHGRIYNPRKTYRESLPREVISIPAAVTCMELTGYSILIWLIFSIEKYSQRDLM